MIDFRRNAWSFDKWHIYLNLLHVIYSYLRVFFHWFISSKEDLAINLSSNTRSRTSTAFSFIRFFNNTILMIWISSYGSYFREAGNVKIYFSACQDRYSTQKSPEWIIKTKNNFYKLLTPQYIYYWLALISRIPFQLHKKTIVYFSADLL